ncbi:unnamed protein product [Nezara viridula]|uniref:Uncharacterized protein n=1 Tax=Nezara viridula TaxID=85310 RepID=A0A9P0H3I4_NEZVI|nr:unnamed protein product [Nezara viridula]
MTLSAPCSSLSLYPSYSCKGTNIFLSILLSWGGLEAGGPLGPEFPGLGAEQGPQFLSQQPAPEPHLHRDSPEFISSQELKPSNIPFLPVPLPSGIPCNLISDILLPCPHSNTFFTNTFSHP